VIGGYNTKRHGSLSGGGWQAIQLECNSIGVRDSRENRIKFAAAFVDVILKWCTTPSLPCHCPVLPYRFVSVLVFSSLLVLILWV
jgi:hypothetical protein